MEQIDTVFDFVMAFHRKFTLWSVEHRGQPTTNSEIRRWFANKAVHYNGEAATMDTLFTPASDSITLFPKGARKTTLW